MSFVAKAFTPRVQDAFQTVSPFGQNLTPQVRAQAAAQAVAEVHLAAQRKLAEFLRSRNDKAQSPEPAAWPSNAVPARPAVFAVPQTGGIVPQAQTGQLATATNFWAALSVAGTALGAYHGYKRTTSIPWTIAWALLGGLFPVITVPVAVAQGFGKREPSFR